MDVAEESQELSEEHARIIERAERGESSAGEIVFELVDLLTVIAGHGALLEVTLAESDNRRQDATAIVLAARRAAGLTARLRALTRDA